MRLSILSFSVCVALAGCADNGIASFNTPPQANITLPSDGAESDSASITFQGTAIDDQDLAPSLLVTFKSSLQETPLFEGAPDVDGFVQFTAQLGAGQHLITLTVVDTKGLTDEDSITVTILADPPLVTINEPLSGYSYYEGDPVHFLGSVQNHDGTDRSLQVIWVSDIQGGLQTGQTADDGVSSFDANLIAGTHVIELRGTDDVGAVGLDSTTIEVSSTPTGQMDQDGDTFCPDGIDADGDGTCLDAEVTGVNSQDCNDFNDGVCPACPEICDGVDDNNCDHIPDANDIDYDGDGWTACMGDCDNQNPFVYPGQAEACDGWDTNCDGFTPGDEVDADGDNYRICHGDCDDTNAARNPGATEICDSIDNDCDLLIDEGFDADNDTWSTCEGDCNDQNNNIHPQAIEVCQNPAWDDDCDGIYNENADPTELGESGPQAYNEAIQIATFGHIIGFPWSPCSGGSCAPIGSGLTLCENNVQTSGAFTSAYDIFDAYYIEYNSTLATLTGCSMEVSLTSIPAGHNYSIALYGTDGINDPVSSWDLLGQSNVAGSGNESIVYSNLDIFALFDEPTFVVVVYSNGYFACPAVGSYTLNISGF